MNIVILDDYQDAVRKLDCAAKLDAHPFKVYTNTVKGLGQLSIRLRDADIIVLIRERTAITRALLEKLPRLKLIAQTGRAGPHIDMAACTERGIAVAEGMGSPVAPAELTWALIMAAMRRLPQYIGNLKHGAWQQSGLKSN
ncbi:MAG: D-2-hydroxyacid dehydrogenase family protein, partial [Hylemonella sp.]|nr:D-2-hydroxyacid dehydrogenase family protein [Hylemonella sp.]